MRYDYKCSHCNEELELQKKMNDPHPTQCPFCGEPGLYRIFKSAPVVEFKGDWFRNKGKY